VKAHVLAALDQRVAVAVVVEFERRPVGHAEIDERARRQEVLASSLPTTSR
jgi:hypothetical protein